MPKRLMTAFHLFELERRHHGVAGSEIEHGRPVMAVCEGGGIMEVVDGSGLNGRRGDVGKDNQECEGEKDSAHRNLISFEHIIYIIN